MFFLENQFTDRVAKSFAETLKVNTSLVELDLSYNEFCEQGGLYIGAGLVCFFFLLKYFIIATVRKIINCISYSL